MIKDKNPKNTNIDILKARNDELGLLSNSLDDMTLELQKGFPMQKIFQLILFMKYVIHLHL